jgi:hypothetical protein
MSSLKQLRALGLSALLAVTAVSSPRPANASISIAVTFDTLVERADSALVVVPIESNSVWEGQRIVTYTKMRVEKAIAGQGASEVTVKTLGGSIGDLGQSVSGEPSFPPGEKSVVFLRKVDSALMVVERAQGQYPLLLDKASQRWVTRKASDVGMTIPRALNAAVADGSAAPVTSASPSVAVSALKPTRYAGSLASDVLIHRPVEDVAQDIVDAWAKRHPVPAAPAK